MDKKFKKEVQNWIKNIAIMGKELNALDKEAQKQDFSQGQRQLEILNNEFKREWMSQIKRLFLVVK